MAERVVNPDDICQQVMQAKLNMYQAKENADATLKAYNDQVGELVGVIGILKTHILKIEKELTELKDAKKGGNDA